MQVKLFLLIILAISCFEIVNCCWMTSIFANRPSNKPRKLPLDFTKYGDAILGINKCVKREALCNPFLMDPCCDPNDTCVSINWHEEPEIFACREGGLIGKLCQINEDCHEDGKIYHELGFNNMVECEIPRRICACKEGYVTLDTKVCSALLESYCVDDVNCATKNAYCDKNNDKCKCNNGYRPKGDNQCIEKKPWLIEREYNLI